MRSPRLAALELKRFGRGKLPRAAMAAMLLIPLLYGALYLWSFWNPYDRLDRIPVALVNEDRGTTVKEDDGDRRRITAGDDIVEGLRDSDTFDWREVDAAEAERGVADGTYYLSLTIPDDFSAKVASSSGDDPETGALRVHTNDSNNYIVGQISRTVFSEVRASASTRTSGGFYDRIFISFSSLHKATSDAADGAKELDDGLGKAKDGSGELADGSAKAKQGSADLKQGVGDLHRGSARLVEGTGKLTEGTKQLVDEVNKRTKQLEPLAKPKAGEDIATVAGEVADGAATARRVVAALPRDSQESARLGRRAADGSAKVYSAVCERPGGLPAPGEGTAPGSDGDGGGEAAGPDDSATRSVSPADGVDCAEFKRNVDEGRKAAELAETVSKHVRENGGNLDSLQRDLAKLERTAREIEKRAPNLGAELDKAVRDANALHRGAQSIDKGMRQLNTGLASAAGGAGRLDSGLADISSGARSLDGGLFKLADGSGELSKGLRDGAEKIPDYDKKDREERSEVMADPIRLVTENSNAAANYGTGFAPYFIPLSLWVGAMVCYMLLAPLNRRALAAGAPAWRTALAGLLPVAAIGVAQVLTLMAVLRYGLGLEMDRAAGTVGFLLLVTVCFAAIIQWLNAKFGPAGRILVLAVLMLQLTSAGGTYPVETSPGFFNAIHPFLPMSHVVAALRVLITGGDLGAVWQACGVLVAFTVGALALTALTARRSAVWTMKRLHPELSL
ncbi:YhgE/Pip domain-containing protein [Streptomyces durbertensis]|uniref:YhgE/Pip domain-containing protein n=1 Tax=Streptomyces durbertensis TaxID=2448886 RepID=A0ABR6EGU6_9ACTN|nr:YhgE/Pip domain-containing protein [Streptomyces durbertensis]MBB1244551.1 YhgE/Pip domain-containing protein [Streptomyces durbertensis]